MSDLPEPIDATQPGIFDLGKMKMFNLGDDVWIVAGRDGELINAVLQRMRASIPGVVALGISTDYAANYVPLEKSVDLTRMIRLIVREEMNKVVNNATE